MLVDTSQWRAAIGLFRLSSCVSLRMPLSIRASLMMWHVLRLYTFCYIFITLAIFILPFSMITQGILLYFGCSQFSFLHVFAHSYSRCKKVFHLTWNLTVLTLIQLCSNCSCAVIRKVVFLYCYGYVVCAFLYMHYTQWVIFKSILLSGDVEENPGPDSGIFKFCTWNLNSIAAHDFFRVSLLEAYNSVYNYDLMAITETHLDSKVDKSKLGIDGYTFLNNNHPLDIKRGRVRLYIKILFLLSGVLS